MRAGGLYAGLMAEPVRDAEAPEIDGSPVEAPGPAAAAPGAAVLVPPADAAALADAIAARLVSLGPTSTEFRRARAVLRTPEPERFAAVFRGVHQAPARPQPSKAAPSSKTVVPEE
jgi:hypothetical protein